MTKVDVFNGDQIGGCVTVIKTEVDGKVHRIMIDYGESLPGSDNSEPFNYPWDTEPVDAVFFTHNHMDHIGRLLEIPEEVPIYMGSIARQVMINMQSYLARGRGEEVAKHRRELEILKDESRTHTFTSEDKISITGFTITPHIVCHSAFDSYMFLVETGDKVILHTGDYRGHGRFGDRMIPAIKEIRAEKEINYLITEGTMMTRSSEHVMTEDEMMMEAAEYMKNHKYVFLVCASTNLDSIASFYQAAQIASEPYGRYLYVYNNYYLTQLRYFADVAGKINEVYDMKNIFKLEPYKELKSKSWKKPMLQKDLCEITGFLAMIKPEEWCEQYIMPFIEDYRDGKITEMPVIIYSMWDGYLRDDPANTAKIESWVNFTQKMEKKGVEIKHLHTSGHATPQMITEVINAACPTDEIIPLHQEVEKLQALLIKM
ncbi:MAG: MBL fold metallo-hydrolase, partial [Clostridia bacterium]|nr:MBL fold metallo-hydrolase [Clostridia bacterium]